MKSLQIHEAARREANFATLWYAERSMSSAEHFSDILLSGFAMIVRFPERYSSYLHGTQRLVLDKFPYSIVYLDWQDEVCIVAVAHAKRRPGYWKSRI